VLSRSGITRCGRGKGFSYLAPDGEPLDDDATLRRIKELVIPPAWKKVWVSPHRNDHIQAVGTDVAGRRQYLYHEQWQEERAEEKFDRVLELSKQLPAWRSHIADDLKSTGLKRDRVLALALHLLDRGYFRAGGEQYAEDNDSYGIATLLCEHVTLRSDVVVFDYPGESGVRRPWRSSTQKWCAPHGRCCGATTERSDFWCAAPRPAGSMCTPTISTRGSRSWSGTSTASRTSAPGMGLCWPRRRSSTPIRRPPRG
jgi:DNA topoisomerase IB